MVHRVKANCNYYLIGDNQSLDIALNRNFYLDKEKKIALNNVDVIDSVLIHSISDLKDNLFIFVDIIDRPKLNHQLNTLGLELGTHYMYYYNTPENIEIIGLNPQIYLFSLV